MRHDTAVVMGPTAHIEYADNCTFIELDTTRLRPWYNAERRSATRGNPLIEGALPNNLIPGIASCGTIPFASASRRGMWVFIPLEISRPNGRSWGTITATSVLQLDARVAFSTHIMMAASRPATKRYHRQSSKQGEIYDDQPGACIEIPQSAKFNATLLDKSSPIALAVP
ncbi:hypothetical protein FHL15_009184 [Xylaria flabelliformis]|uniref:Uncharacterized protein n=1 Tax=Xylaria flabelliformis TaxID=2512241 RepID=A0A553HPN5_9PEZI|nr:hypothetical protein FHL15_009184 [Xylaria flabelliformis]